MKKMTVSLTIAVTIILAMTLNIQVAGAAEAAKEGSLGAAGVDGGSGHGAKKAKGPIDSSVVIPKGPQWLGAPIMADGKEVSKDSGRLSTEYNLPYKDVLTWYQNALKDYPDARYRDWDEEMYIEDQGGSKWHAIKISKTGGSKTTVTIVKDNWTWIMATLFIRFAGVFIVLLVLWLFLNISTAIMLRFIKEEKKTAAAKA